MKFYFVRNKHDNGAYFEIIMKKRFFLISSLFFIFSAFQLSADKKKLEILFIVDRFLPRSQIFVLNQITGLIDLGHKITILAENSITRAVYHPNIEKYKLLKRVHVKTLPTHKREFDIILCQFGDIGRRFLQTKKELGITGKVITFFRGLDSRAAKLNNKTYYKELFEKGDYFLAVCQFLKDELIQAGCDPLKIDILHSAIDLTKFIFKIPTPPKKNKPINIVSVGRLVEKKGMKFAIQATDELRKKNMNVELFIIGMGPLEMELQLAHLVKTLGLTDRVHLVGSKSHNEVIKILEKAHIFVLASVHATNGDREGIPNALKEAMAMGIPVVSTYHSGIPELIQDGISGFLAPESNSKILAEKIEFLIKHPEIWQKICLKAKKIVHSQYDMVKENKKLEKICLKVLKNKSVTKEWSNKRT